MEPYAWLAGYCLLVLLFSVFGGSVPFLGRATHSKLQLYLSVSAGVMLGAAIFHVLPDAFELSGEMLGWWMALAVVGLFCIERFIAPHSHEVNGRGPHDHGHGPHAHAEHAHAHKADHEHDHGHDHGPHAADPKGHRAAAPPVAGWMAVLALTIHTFMNGVGLAGAVLYEAENPGKAESPLGGVAGLALPGLAMFLAIFLHKPADALAISTVLSRKGVSRRMIFLVQFGFALMVPAGVIAFVVARQALTATLQTQLTGAALAFSAGTFFFIALSDLLPEVQFHRHDRIPLFLALTLSVALMGGIALLEGHHHGDHEQPAPGKVEGDEKPDADHDHEHEAGHPHHHH
jgi:zinc and cadmium transporter